MLITTSLEIPIYQRRFHIGITNDFVKDIKKIDESGKKRGIIIPYDMLSGW